MVKSGMWIESIRGAVASTTHAMTISRSTHADAIVRVCSDSRLVPGSSSASEERGEVMKNPASITAVRALKALVTTSICLLYRALSRGAMMIEAALGCRKPLNALASCTLPSGPGRMLAVDTEIRVAAGEYIHDMWRKVRMLRARCASVS
jgi:hypothetical protein